MNSSNPFTQDLGSFSVASQPEQVRAAFIRRTYAHVAAALFIFTGVCAAIVNSPLAEPITRLMLGNQFSWLIVLAAFMVVSWLANKWAMSDTSQGMQYLGLGVYVVAQALIFTPLLFIANTYYPGIIVQAGFLTVILFLGLTLIAFTTKKDFSFLGGILKIGFMVALGVIVCGILFQFTLGIVFSAVMIALAGGSILYNTSQIQYHYNPAQHVAAALSLFASVALLFWYILQLLMSLQGRD